MDDERQRKIAEAQAELTKLIARQKELEKEGTTWGTPEYDANHVRIRQLKSEIAEYLAGLSASVFVLDYDANAPSVEHLQKTHEPLYQTIRNKNPETPIIFITLPFKEVDYCKRRAVIYQTYQKAQQTGDKNVWFLDGMTVYGEKDRDACTVDLIHPNDLGFYRMAETIRPLLEEALKHNGTEKV